MLNRQAGIVSNNYKVDSTPTIVVDGRYVTSPVQVSGATHTRDQQQLFQETFQVVDALIAQAQTAKK